MTKLVEDDQVLAVLGPTLSNEATAADPVAQDAGTSVLGVSNTASGLRELIGDYYHRDSLPEAVVIPGTIEQAASLLGLEKVGVLYGNDDDFTVSGYDVFAQALTDNNIETVGTETFAKGDVDFNAQLTNLISQNPDALVVSALAAEAVQIINQARQLGYSWTDHRRQRLQLADRPEANRREFRRLDRRRRVELRQPEPQRQQRAVRAGV